MEVWKPEPTRQKNRTSDRTLERVQFTTRNGNKRRYVLPFFIVTKHIADTFVFCRSTDNEQPTEQLQVFINSRASFCYQLEMSDLWSPSAYIPLSVSAVLLSISSIIFWKGAKWKSVNQLHAVCISS
jgi:hypothetical protein